MYLSLARQFPVFFDNQHCQVEQQSTQQCMLCYVVSYVLGDDALIS